MRAMAKSKQSASVVRVGINGFGRVGRCVARALSTQAGDGLRLVAINSPSGAKIGAHLLRHDSTHGIFAAEVEAVGDSIKIDGRKIPFTTARDIPSLRWPAVDVALECSGRFNSRAAAAAHLQNGAAAVAVSAPVEDADATVAPGINDDDLPKAARVVSAGSCTTNCLAPIAVVLREAVGIESGANLDRACGDSRSADFGFVACRFAPRPRRFRFDHSDQNRGGAIDRQSRSGARWQIIRNRFARSAFECVFAGFDFRPDSQNHGGAN